MSGVTGRFAPSPSGYMHLGNVSVALLAWLSAKSRGGEIVLRIEDLDPARSRREYTEALMDDLLWLGLPWDRRAVDQSLRGEVYRTAMARLDTYPCYCSRDELRAASAPHASDGRVIYPGTCRHLTDDGVAAYQLAVVVDDAENGVTEVVRGRDLLSSTPAQLWLYEALGLTPPAFYHTPMLLAPDGRRLSKRDGDLNLRALRHLQPAQDGAP